MPKANCKYWDKCYQRNEIHLSKYNHPKKSTDDKESSDRSAVYPRTGGEKNARKRGHSEDVPCDVSSNMQDTKPLLQTERESRDQCDTQDLREEVLARMSGKAYMDKINRQIEASALAEYNKLCTSKEFLYNKFLVEMPQDFYNFWDFVTHLKSNCDGENALAFLKEEYQLHLVGPFDFMAGRFHKASIMEPGNYLRHWRFFYDPPEFQTVFVLNGTGVHYGYWRDKPTDKEHLLVGRNNASESCEFQFVANNLFDAFLHFLNVDFQSMPFTAHRVASIKKAIEAFIEAKNIEITKMHRITNLRNKYVVAKGFHRAGIVVHCDPKSMVGYRPPLLSECELKNIVKPLGTFSGDDEIKRSVMEKLQPAINAANIATDECDFGTALELGLNMFASGYKELHSLISSITIPAYSLLKRPQFIAILKSHLENRKEGIELSILD